MAGSDEQVSSQRTSFITTKKVSGKRRAGVKGGSGDVKRALIALPVPDANGLVGEKKPIIQRLWSKDDEVELIKGMIKYVEEKGKDPIVNVTDFHDFVKESVHVDVNDKQFLKKVRRLKYKYEHNASKLENDRKVKSFSNPHEKKLYELSKNLWGNDKVVKVKKVNDDEDVGLVLGEEGIMKKGLESVSGTIKVEMMTKWNELKLKELKHFVNKLDVLKEQAHVVVDALQESSSAN